MKDQVEDEVTRGHHYHVQFVNRKVVVGEVQVVLIELSVSGLSSFLNVRRAFLAPTPTSPILIVFFSMVATVYSFILLLSVAWLGTLFYFHNTSVHRMW